MTALSLDDAKNFLRYETTDTDQDPTLTTLLAAGQDYVERITGHLLTQREVTQGASELAGAITLNKYPIDPDQPITITYFDTDGAAQTITTARLAACLRPAYLTPAFQTTWPIADCGQPITITYTAGYASADDVPAGLLHAMLVYAGMGDDARNGNVTPEAWAAINALCQPYLVAAL